MKGGGKTGILAKVSCKGRYPPLPIDRNACGCFNPQALREDKGRYPPLSTPQNRRREKRRITCVLWAASASSWPLDLGEDAEFVPDEDEAR